MISILHIVAALLGAWVFYLTFVMRESTEGKWVNRIEEMWIRIDDRNKAVGETTKSLFNVVAGKVSRTFNRIVGTKIFSARLVGISGSLSFATAFFIYGAFFELMAYFVVAYADLIKRMVSNAATLQHAVPLFIVAGIVLFLFCGFCAMLAILPIAFKSPIWAWISCAPTILGFLLFVWLVFLHKMNGSHLTLLLAPVLSLSSDILLLIIIRQSLRWMLASTTLRRMTITIVIQLVQFAIVFLIPLRILYTNALTNPKSDIPVGMLILVVFNIPTAIASTAFLSLLLLVLLHRVTWPLLSQLTYILTRNEVLEKRGLVRTIAVGLMVYGLSGIPSFILRAIEFFNK
jgi:hypothetical protein